MNETDLFVGGEGGHHAYRIPALVAASRRTLLAFCEGRKQSASDQGDIDLLLRRSVDGGRTWEDPLLVHEEGEGAPIAIGNPCPLVERGGERIHLLFTRNNRRVLYCRSTDEGRTWSAPVDWTAALDGFRYACVRVGTGPVHGIQTRNGRLVAPLWVSDRSLEDRNRDVTAHRYQGGVLFSDDGGDTWRAGGLVPPAISRLNEGVVAERRDGSLLFNLRANGAGFRVTSTSSDAGLTWSTPRLEPGLPCPDCQAGMAVGPDGGFFFLNPAVSHAGGYDAGSRRCLTLRGSGDEGRTWRTLQVIQDGPAGYSDLCVTREREVLCLFERGIQTYHERISFARIPLDS